MSDLQLTDECERKDFFTAIRDFGKLALKKLMLDLSISPSLILMEKS